MSPSKARTPIGGTAYVGTCSSPEPRPASSRGWHRVLSTRPFSPRRSSASRSSSCFAICSIRVCRAVRSVEHQRSEIKPCPGDLNHHHFKALPCPPRGAQSKALPRPRPPPESPALSASPSAVAFWRRRSYTFSARMHRERKKSRRGMQESGNAFNSTRECRESHAPRPLPPISGPDSS